GSDPPWPRTRSWGGRSRILLIDGCDLEVAVASGGTPSTAELFPGLPEPLDGQIQIIFVITQQIHPQISADGQERQGHWVVVFAGEGCACAGSGGVEALQVGTGVIRVLVWGDDVLVHLHCVFTG